MYYTIEIPIETGGIMVERILGLIDPVEIPPHYTREFLRRSLQPGLIDLDAFSNISEEIDKPLAEKSRGGNTAVYEFSADERNMSIDSDEDEGGDGEAQAEAFLKEWRESAAAAEKALSTGSTET